MVIFLLPYRKDPVLSFRDCAYVCVYRVENGSLIVLDALNIYESFK